MRWGEGRELRSPLWGAPDTQLPSASAFCVCWRQVNSLQGHGTPLPWLYTHSLFFDAGVVLKERLVKTNHHLLLEKNEKKGKKSSLLSLCLSKLPKVLLLREGTSGVLSARQPREHQRSQGLGGGWVGGIM